MKPLTSESLLEVSCSFKSPVTGDVYAVTQLGVTLAKLRQWLNSLLIDLFPELYADRQSDYMTVVLAASADNNETHKTHKIVESLVTTYRLFLEEQAKAGEEESWAKRIRYAVGDLLKLADPEAHAVYHTLKTPSGEASKTVESISAAAVYAYRRLLELGYVAGI